MPDFGAPVAQNIQAPNVLGSIAGLLDLKTKQQGIQSQALQIQQQQQNLQRGAAETQQQQQTAQQRQSIAGVDWQKYTDPEGMVSTDKMLSDPTLRQAAGDQFLPLMQQAAGVRIQQTQAKSQLASLNSELRGQFGGALGALRTDPDVLADNAAGRAKVTAQLAQFAESGGPDAARIAQIYSPLVEHVPQGQLARSISTLQLQAQAADRQAASQAPNYVNEGATLQQVNPQAAGGNLSGTGTAPGGGLTVQVPPTQPTMGGPTGTTPGVLGPHPSVVAPGAATPAASAPIRNNNPMALMTPDGKTLQSFQTPEAGMAAGDALLKKYGSNGPMTLDQIVRKWTGNLPANNPDAYIGEIAQRLSIKPDTKIDLSNPLQRSALGNAMALHESSPASVFGGSQAPASPQGTAGAGFVPTGLPVGQVGNLENNVSEMNRHYGALQDVSTGNPLVESLVGNVKSLAGKAITGTESDKLSYVNGLLAHLPGFAGQPSTDLKTATDILEKNLSQLNLTTPAATDAARTLVTAARPNSHMTAEAINEASDLIASQVRANMAERNLLSGYKAQGDTQGYQKLREQFEKVGDPRAFQYEALGPGSPAAVQFLQKLKPADAADLVKRKIPALVQMGVFK